MQIAGPYVPGRNWSADAGSGSIHDDATAADLGFRGGTVAGDVHMNQFVPVLLDAFGPAWWQQGYLALDFRTATIDRERVRVLLESGDDTAPVEQAQVEMQRDDGRLVARGVAGLGALPPLEAERSRIDSRASLRILGLVAPGQSLGRYDVLTEPDKQLQRFDAGLISDALPEYRTGFGNDGRRIPACPSTVVEFLWGPPMAALRPLIDPRAVGLFGAIDLAHDKGPLWLNRRYRIDAHVIGLGASPKTELLWFESTATDVAGQGVVRFRMMLRFMKASVTGEAP